MKTIAIYGKLKEDICELFQKLNQEYQIKFNEIDPDIIVIFPGNYNTLSKLFHLLHLEKRVILMNGEYYIQQHQYWVFDFS